MYLTLDKWLKLFITTNISYDIFISKAKVKSSNNKIDSLKDIIKKKKTQTNFS